MNLPVSRGHARPARTLRCPGAAASIAAALILGACGEKQVETGAAAPAAPAQTPPPVPAQAPAAAAPTDSAVVVGFVVTATPEVGDTPPNSSVDFVVTTGGAAPVRTPVATYAGACNLEDPAAEGSIASVRCWWAGAGRTVQALRDGDGIVIKQLQIFEEAAEDQAEASPSHRFPLAPGATVRAAPIPAAP